MSDIAVQMLDSLSSEGAMGLALWPEDLRHPFSVVPVKPILSPEDFVGLTVRARPSEVTHKLIETLGGTPMFGDTNYQAAESGLRQEFSLTGQPTATGNIIFFPKSQVLFANGTAFEKLGEEERVVLRNAAAAVQIIAVAEHPKETDAATAWYEDGGTILMASDEQVAAFEVAAQPVTTQLEEDALTARMIAAILELKIVTEPFPGSHACMPEAAQQTSDPSTETQVWSTGLPPNGVWQVELTADDLVQMGVLRSTATNEWAGVYTLTLQDGKSLTVWQGEQGQSGKCQATYELVGDVVRFTYFTDTYECEGEVDDIQWRLDDEGLHLHLVDVKNAPSTEIRAYLEAKPWQKVSDP